VPVSYKRKGESAKWDERFLQVRMTIRRKKKKKTFERRRKRKRGGGGYLFTQRTMIQKGKLGKSQEGGPSRSVKCYRTSLALRRGNQSERRSNRKDL